MAAATTAHSSIDDEHSRRSSSAGSKLIGRINSSGSSGANYNSHTPNARYKQQQQHHDHQQHHHHHHHHQQQQQQQQQHYSSLMRQPMKLNIPAIALALYSNATIVLAAALHNSSQHNGHSNGDTLTINRPSSQSDNSGGGGGGNTNSTTTSDIITLNNYTNVHQQHAASYVSYVADSLAASSASAASMAAAASLAAFAAMQNNMSVAAYDDNVMDIIDDIQRLSESGNASAMQNITPTGMGGQDVTAGNSTDSYDLVMFSWQNICQLTIFCAFIVITIIGNTLVILAVITTRRLKTVTNCFVMSLAVADLLVGIFVMPPAVAVHLIGSWPLGWVLCDIWISLDVLLCTASILSLCAISVDRYLAVTQPLTYSRKRRSKRLALIMILIVWILALAITCPPILGWYEPGRRDLSVCRYNRNEGYVIFSAMGSFFIPMAVMIYVYARISCVIASRHDNMTDISVHNKKFKRYTSADVENDIDHDFSEHDHSTLQQKKQAAVRTFSNQTLAKELQEVMLSEGDNGSAEPTHCHSLLTLPTAASAGGGGAGKNGSYELTRPASLRRTPTASSTMTTMTSTCGIGMGAGTDVHPPPAHHQWTTRSHSVRYQHHSSHPSHTHAQSHPPHPHHHHLSAPPITSTNVNANSGGGGGGGGGISTHVLSSSPNMQNTTTLLRQTRSHHHHHHAKSFSNRVTSLKKENKTTQTLSIVVGGFIACWLPFFVNYLLTPFLEPHQVSPTLAEVLTWLGWFNSAINPFIYAFYSVDFRAAFWRLTCKRFFSSSSMKPQFPTNTMSIRR